MNNQWGTVCTDSWGANDATVVCQQLGYTTQGQIKTRRNLYFPFQKSKTFVQTGALPFSSAHFGNGAGPIHLDNVDCSGSESSLANCPHSSFISCYNNVNAGVRCQGRVMFICGNLVRSIELDKMTLS